jgi:hypothetical protein
MDIAATLKTLGSTLNSSASELQRVTPALDKPDGMRGRIVSQLALLIPEGATAHFEAHIDDRESEKGTAQLVAFTEDQIVVVRRTGGEEPTTQVAARRALRTLNVLQAPNLSSGGDGARLHLELDYGDALDAPVRLGHDRQSDDNALELNAFLPELLADLNRG